MRGETSCARACGRAAAAVFQCRVDVQPRKPQRRRETEQNPRADRDRDQVRQNSVVHRVIQDQPRGFLRHGPRIQIEAPSGQHQPRNRRSGSIRLSTRSWRTMRQRPAPSAMRTEISRDDANRARQQQIRQIRARDQQHESDGAPHDPYSTAALEPIKNSVKSLHRPDARADR